MLTDRKTGVVLLNDKGRDTLVALALVRHGKDDIDVSVLSIGDKDLITIEYVALLLLDSKGLLCGSVCTSIGLRETKGTDPLA